MKDNKKKRITSKTKMQVIVEKYGVDFGEDNLLEVNEFLRKRGYKSLANLLENKIA